MGDIMISLQESVKRAETSIEEAKWENEQRQLLRGLMNIRAPKRCSEEFLRIQDAYLQEAVKEKGIVE